MAAMEIALLISSCLCLAASTIIFFVALFVSGILGDIAYGIKKACVWFINLFLPNGRKINLEPSLPQITISITEPYDGAESAVSESGESGEKDSTVNSGISPDGNGTLQADRREIDGDGAVVPPVNFHSDR